MEQVIVKLQEWITLYGLKVIAAVIILIVGRIAAGALRTLVRRLLQKSRMEETLILFTVKLTYIAVMVFVILAALGQLGIQTTSFIAVIGAAGLAIGLALQGSLANFAAGFLMIIFKPFKIGDYIEAGGIAGTVEAIGVFTTELTSPDNKKIIIPNAKATADSIINYSTKDKRRVDLVASVSYGDDLGKVRKVLEGILSEDERVLKEPAPTIGVLELADSSVNFAVRPWVKTADYWNVFFALQETIKNRFDAEGITIPFPQQDIHLHKEQ
ncbi:MAG TPA: mechanosensitive ion channel [Syntrophales bacterium]|nr:mechanosensitive ion channel [Syntrophales bacterium]